LKTSWLKFNPDYDNASHSFDKAGNHIHCVNDRDKKVSLNVNERAL